MHYLVTGGCGFIGSHLCENLLAAGHQVTALDDLSTGKRHNVPAAVRIIEGDITTPGIFDSIVRDIDGCFHLAAIASVELSKNEWLRTHQVNISGTIALFEAIAKSGRHVPVVYASSAATYGDCKDEPFLETSFPTPLSAYGADKLACDQHARIAHHVHGIPTAGMRFFNVYGPRQDPLSPYTGVISIFASRMKQNQSIVIHGKGDQSRDFIYVSDVAKALTLAMDALASKKISQEIFNICTGRHVSIKELAGIVMKVTGSASSISHGERRPGDAQTSSGDPAKAKTLLGFSAEVTLEDGLKQTLGSL